VEDLSSRSAQEVLDEHLNIAQTGGTEDDIERLKCLRERIPSRASRGGEMKKSVAAVTAISSLFGGLLGSSGALVELFYSIFPDRKPVARGEIAGALKILAVERGVAWTDYERRTNRAADPCGRRNDGSLLGNITYVQVKTTGFKARPTQLRWAVYNRSGRRVKQDYYSDQAVLPTREAPVDTSVYPAWTPFPVGRGSYLVRVQLLTQKVPPRSDLVDPRTRQLKTSDSCTSLPDQTGVNDPPVILALADTAVLRGQRRFSSSRLKLRDIDGQRPPVPE